MDPAKLKVVELRQELQNRGLDTKGVKAVLVDRLKAALEAEGAAIRDQVLGLSPVKSDGHVSQEESAAEDEVGAEATETEAPVAVAAEPEADPEPEPQQEPEPEPQEEPESVPIPVDPVEPADEPLDNSQYHLSETHPMDQTVTATPSSVTEESVSAASATNDASTEDVEMTAATANAIDEENDNAADVPEEEAGAEKDPGEQQQQTPTEGEAMEVVTDAVSTVPEANTDEASQETTPADDLAKAATETQTTASATPSESDKKESGGGDRKRKRSRSASPKAPRRQRTNSTAANTDDFTSVEDEPEIDAEKVTLSWFDSDIQLRINAATDFCDARPISDAAFGLVWAGARATHGVKVGQKVFYEVQLQQKNSRVNFEQEKNLFNLRCGWSTLDSDLHLGDGPLSFGYDGEGKKYRGGVAEDFGKAFEVDDVVGVYLDLQSEPCTIEYTLNGESLGIAFEFPQEELGEAALFPHIITKNVQFKVNFGQLEKNLLADLKAKPKKKPVPVVVAAEPEQKKEEANGENGAEKKDSEDSATPAEGEEEKKTESEAEVKAEGDEAEMKAESAEETPKEEPESTSVDVEMKEEPEKTEGEPEKKPEEESVSEENKPAEEVKEESAAEEITNAEETPATEEVKPEEEEEEPLPEINRENLPGFIFIGLVEKDQLVAGPVRPESRKECEVILMIGLSAAGKTKWVNDWVAQNPEKKYVVLGASALIDRMKNPNVGRKVESAGRRQRLSELCARSLGNIHDVAQKRRRNYIVDQTNVFAAVQRRKMKGFGDFRRVAVIVVPTDEEYQKRQESSKNDIDKDNTETELNEMKANFTLPTADLGWFDEIKYVELEEAEALKLVEDYNAKGKKALPPPAKKRQNNDYHRNDNRRRDWNNRDNRSQSRWGGTSQDYRRGGGGGGGGYDNRGGDRWAQRSAPYGGNSGGGGGGGGYRRYDDRRQDSRWGGSSGGGGGGGAGGNNWMNNNRRDFRSGGGGGGGGRSDYGRSDSYRDQHSRSHYGGGGGSSSSGGHRDSYHHSSSSGSSSSYRRNDGRDQDFRERRREDGGITNRRYDSTASSTGGGLRHDPYHKRDNGSAKSSNMMNNGSSSAWNNAASNWQAQQQQQLQWSNWQQQSGGHTATSWDQGWAQALQNTGWQTGTTTGNWAPATGTSAASTTSASSGGGGGWKSYGSATGASGTTSSSGATTGQWNGQQWTGGSSY